ncbi:hypothetical protein LINPERPRIM_LOCUS1737 [Linum perenne]
MTSQLRGGNYAPCPAISVYRLSSSGRPLGITAVSCLASGTKFTTSDHLRSQLHQLRSEADSARADANSARMRFMRLSEAAQNLKRQAAVCVQSQREDEARQLLFQKKKVMQAIEKSKSRIEVLDELCSKLNEAISSKESQLIGNLGSDLDVDSEEDSSGPVRVVSPKTKEFPDDSDSTNKEKTSTDMQDLQSCVDGDSNPRYPNPGISNEDRVNNGLSGMSSYYEFLEQTDIQLSKIEAQLVTILKVSALLLNDEEKPENLKVKQTKELLVSIHGIRQQVAEMLEGKMES